MVKTGDFMLIIAHFYISFHKRNLNVTFFKVLHIIAEELA